MSDECEEIVPAETIGTNYCHLCGATVTVWRVREFRRTKEIAKGYYCPVCGEHVWGLRFVAPETPLRPARDEAD